MGEAPGSTCKLENAKGRKSDGKAPARKPPPMPERARRFLKSNGAGTKLGASGWRDTSFHL